MTYSGAQRDGRRSLLLVRAVAVHGIIDVLLTTLPWHLSESMLLVAVAIPVSQNGLVAIWAATSRLPTYLRGAIATAGTITTWTVACTLMPFGFRSEMAVGWLAAFVIQSVVTVLVIYIWRTACLKLNASRLHGASDASAARRGFRLRTLLQWVATISLVLALVRLAAVHLGWTHHVFAWDFLPQLIVIGFYNGLFAGVVFIFLTWPHVWRVRLTAGCLAFAVLTILALSENQLYRLLFTDLGGVTTGKLLLFAAGQSVTLFMTLILLKSNDQLLAPNTCT